ncbi:MAG TPA: polysaccharide biosynthesis tyrosine autokinase [Sphingomonadaceae bacterium]|nr:polysaccharide biosynthesis tyrosine autokinase [Sphingomonadaceae bacterium]
MTNVATDKAIRQLARPAWPGRPLEDDAPGALETPIITQYLRIFWRWKHIIAAAIGVAFVIGVVVTLLTTRLYTATATIEIAREGDKVVKIQGVEAESNAADLEFYQTQYGLLRSRSLAEQVARELKLGENPQFFEMFGEKLDGDAAFDGTKKAVSQAVRDKRVREAARVLLDNLDVSPIRMSRLVEISFTSPEAPLSAKVTNAWAANFIEVNLDRRFQATSYARKFLEGRLEQLRQRLEESERALVRYASAQQIINLPGTGPAAGERSLVADDLSALNNELTVATAERIKAESRVRSKQQEGRGAVNEALNNPAINGLREKRAEVAADYARLMTQFEPGYPQAQALASQIRQLDASIEREESRVHASLDTAYRDALSRETELKTRVDTLKDSLLNLRRRSIQYNIYQRDVDTNRQLYDGLLQRYKEIGVAGGVGTNNISIVDSAITPEKPSRPRVLINLAIALALGAILGVGLALALEQIDETITDPEDIERSLRVALLGAVPKSGDRLPIEALADRKSPIVEAYLALQTNLEFATDHGVPRSISVTSTRPGEGKSTSAYAIALSLARAKKKVVLVDADMRSPSVHHQLGLANEQGLSNLLAGSDDIDAVIRQVGEMMPAVMTSGPLPPNAAELLTGPRLDLVLKALAEHFDHIVVDSPPVMGLADAPLIASRVEGTVFVVEAHGIRRRLVRMALDRLNDAHAHVLGAILTKFDARKAHFGYGYEYGYGYGEVRSAGSA